MSSALVVYDDCNVFHRRISVVLRYYNGGSGIEELDVLGREEVKSYILHRSLTSCLRSPQSNLPRSNEGYLDACPSVQKGSYFGA